MDLFSLFLVSVLLFTCCVPPLFQYCYVEHIYEPINDIADNESVLTVI